MQFVRPSAAGSSAGRRSSRYAGVSDENDAETDVLQHNLQFYRTPPVDTIALLEFESLAIDRLKVLQCVASVAERHKKGSPDYETALTNELKQLKYTIAITPTRVGGASTANYQQTEEQQRLEDRLLEDRRKDHLSHFILRLAFCRSPELQKWFMQQELDLFRFRFGLEGSKSKAAFLRLNGLQMEKADEAVVRQLLPQLRAVCGANAQRVVHAESVFWKVPWKEALDLVKCRKVHLSDGMAFIAESDIVVSVASKFRQNLSRSLARACKYFGYIQEEERLMPILKRLSNKAYLGKDYSVGADKDQITPMMLDSLAQTSFPPCMRQLHSRLRRDHHLKHWGRLQYGLFLKGIGLSMDGALQFWRDEFVKVMDGDKFDKQHAYSIRHNYGKEGKRSDYSPYHCTKIIMANPPGAQDAHGCPFKHSDPAVLRQKLEAMQLTTDKVSKIVQLSKSGFYDQACTRFFEATHRIPEEALGYLIGHPNQYFEESRKVLAGTRQFATPDSTPTESSESSAPSESTMASAPVTEGEDDDAALMAAAEAFDSQADATVAIVTESTPVVG